MSKPKPYAIESKGALLFSIQPRHLSGLVFEGVVYRTVLVRGDSEDEARAALGKACGAQFAPSALKVSLARNV